MNRITELVYAKDATEAKVVADVILKCRELHARIHRHRLPMIGNDGPNSYLTHGRH